MIDPRFIIITAGAMFASLGGEPISPSGRYYRNPEPQNIKPRRKPIGQTGPVVDSTPLTKREKRKLRRSNNG